MKSILVIGLGRFGERLVQKFSELGCEVLAVDRDEARVNAVLPFATNAEIANAASEDYIRSLGVEDFDLCVVALGKDFESSVEITAYLKDYGARFVLSRATSDFHARFLLRNGADKVVYPEQHTADWTAVCYANDTVFDYMPLSDDHSIYEIRVPKRWVGKSIAELDVRQRYRVNVLAVKHGENDLDPVLDPTHVFAEGERVLVMGANRDLKRVLNM